jgi:hypothetical protein
MKHSTEYQSKPPSFAHPFIDDLRLSSEASRVHIHLLRRWRDNGNPIQLDYEKLGHHCFLIDYPDADRGLLEKVAISALNELNNAGVIRKTGTSTYELLTADELGIEGDW